MSSNNKIFLVTDNAAKRIAKLAQTEDDKNVNLRISVLGGGCSGFQYDFQFDSKINDDDLIYTKNDIKVVVDEMSIEYIEGSQLDYVETLGSAAFEINNPNATANCGCGNSFAV